MQIGSISPASAPAQDTAPNPHSPLAVMMRQLKPVVLWVGLFSFTINLCILPVSLYSLQVLDRVLSTHSVETLVWLTLFMFVIFLVAAALMGLRSIVLIRVGNWMMKKLNLVLLPMTLQRASAPGRQTDSQLLKDTDTLRQFVSGNSLVTLMDAPWSLLYLLVLFIIHGSLGLLVTLGAILLLAMGIFNDRSMRTPSAEASKHHIRAISGLDAALRNADAVSAMGMERQIVRRWKGARDLADKGLLLGWHRSAVIESISRYIRLILQIGVTGWSGYLALSAAITPGGIIAASILASRALAPFEGAIAANRSMQEARQAYKRLQAALAHSEERIEGLPLPDVEGRLHIDKLVFTLPGAQKPLIKGIGFQVRAGTVMAIIGPSAAGKSTLARLIAGIWKPTEGAVRLDGGDVYHWPREQFGTLVGYLPQDVEMFEGTVAQNIARLSDNAPEDAIVRAAQMAGAHEMILQLPHGYATEMGPGGIGLSPGQRQRIGLARAFYGPPKLLVLDEPDASLDDFGRAALENALRQAREQGITTVIITHHRSLLRYTDLLMVLRDGLIEKFGPTNDVLSELLKSSQARLGNPPSAPAAAQPAQEG